MTWCECNHVGQFDVSPVFSISLHDNQRPDFMWLQLSATEHFLVRENILVIALVLLLWKLVVFTKKKRKTLNGTWERLLCIFVDERAHAGNFIQTTFGGGFHPVYTDSIGGCRSPFSNFYVPDVSVDFRSTIYQQSNKKNDIRIITLA